MPYLHVKVGKPLCEETVDALRRECEKLIFILPGKTSDNCMIQIEDDCKMYMKGEKNACVFVDIRLYQASPEDKKLAFSAALAKYLQENLDIDPNLIYMNFLELPHWAAAGSFK